MPILTDDLWKAMRAVLGVAGTQRYLPDQQVLPAINGGLRQFNAFVNALFAERKGSEELLQEISVERAFQTNEFGGVTMSEAQLGHKVWTIVAIYPEPVISPANAVAIPAQPAESLWRDDVTIRRSGSFPCLRITKEQSAQTASNKYMPGSEKLANSAMRSYAYYMMGDRSSSAFAPGSSEFVLVPESISGRRIIGVAYLKGVDPVTSFQDLIPYPPSAFQLLRDLSLNELSVRQGSKPLYNVTTDSVRALLMTQA